MTTLRALAGTVVAFSLLAPSAPAQDVVPLAGTGENIQPIARVKVPGANEVELAGDWAFVSSDAIEEVGGTLTIVNIKDPTKPYVQSVWDSAKAGVAKQSFGDVDLSPDGNYAVLTNAHGTGDGEGGVWAAIVDVRDKSNPKLAGVIRDDDQMAYVHTVTLDNGGKTLYTNPQVFATWVADNNGRISIFDISDPTKPVKKGVITGPTSDVALAHDTYIDHRPDGKTLMYAASIHTSDVFDISDPLKASWLQTVAFTGGTISHDVQPNHDRSVLVVDDENLTGQVDESTVGACAKAGSGATSVDFGSVHFYEAAADGTFAGEGATHLGSFQPPPMVGEGYCVAHVFWQAPNENRLTQAYYNGGAWIVDFKDPANATALGNFTPEGGATYWSNKPHNGFMYASNMKGTLDVLRYTGSGWPATAGPAEVQRSARQGVPYVPIAAAGSPAPLPGPSAAPARDLGRFAVTAKVKRVPGKAAAGKKRTLQMSFRNAKGKVVGTLRFQRARGKATTVKVTGVAVTGSYSWVLKADRKVLGKGKFKVRKKSGLSLSAGATLAATLKG